MIAVSRILTATAAAVLLFAGVTGVTGAAVAKPDAAALKASLVLAPAAPEDSVPLSGMELGAAQAAAQVAWDRSGVFSDFTDVYAGSRWVGETMQVFYSDAGDAARVAQFLDSVAQAQSLDSEFHLTVAPAPASQDELFALAAEISRDDSGAWSDRLGVTAISVVDVHEQTGQLEVMAVGSTGPAAPISLGTVTITVTTGASAGPALEDQ